MDSSPLRVTSDLAVRLLRPSRSPRVLVVGDGMVDRYVAGRVDRISPEAPVPVVRVDEERRAPGGAANVAAGVVALGAECRLVCVRGEDRAGRELVEMLRERGVGVEGVSPAPGRPTTVKTRVLSRHQQMLRIDRERTGSVGESARDGLLGAVREGVAWADVVAVVDYDKGAMDGGVGTRTAELAGDAGVPSVVDPKLRNFSDYPGAFLFKPNGRELANAMGAEEAPRTARELGRVRRELDCRHLLVTFGDEGMILLDGDEETALRIPSEAREVYDVSGAGDTVTAVLAAALGGGSGVAEAAALSNFAAGLAVSRLGAVPVGRREILTALDGERRRPPRSDDVPGGTGGEAMEPVEGRPWTENGGS